MSKSKFNDDYVPTDHSQLPVKVDAKEDVSPIPQMPDRFDMDFVEKQLIKIQNSPSLVNNYFRSLKTKFSLKKQEQILDRMRKVNEAVAGGIASQIDIIRWRKELLLAEMDLTDIDDEYEIKKLEKKSERLDLELQIALKKQDIKEVKEPKKEESGLAEYEKQKREKQARHRIDRKIRKEDARQGIIDGINQDEEIRKAFQEALDQLDREYGDLSQLSTEKLREYTQRRENLEDKMYDMLDLDGED